MKKLSVFIAAIVCSVVFSIGAKAQAPADYFAGKWSVLVTGTPNGDAKFIVSLERKDGKFTGGLTDPATNKEITSFTKIEESEKNVTVYFTSQTYNVYLFLEKKDDNNVTGSMMDMFDATGERIIPAADTTK